MKKKKIIRGVLRYLFVTTLAVILGVNLYTAVSSRLTNNPLPMPFGIGISVVLTGSMEPTIAAGDLIIVRDTGEYQKDDIIVYRSGNNSICHRIVETDGSTFVTQGDANSGKDDPISRSQILGEVVLVLPYFGYLFNGLKSTPGILLTIVAVILILNFGIKKDKKEQASEKQKLLQELAEISKETEELAKNKAKKGS